MGVSDKGRFQITMRRLRRETIDRYLPHMDKVIVKLRLTNQTDLVLKKHKARKAAPRSVEVDALVDTGATRLYLKPSVIRALGLTPSGKIISRTTNGDRERTVYSAVHLRLNEREGEFQVVDVDETVPNLLGQIPLEYLDLVVDPKGQRLIPNPEHGDKLMTEEY
jgi:predicted aspartyl protease